MYQPIIRTGNARKIDIDAFGGLNRTDTIADEEFSDMENISPSYPYTAVRAGQKPIDCISACPHQILSLEKNGDKRLFTGIAKSNEKTRFYYRNKLIAYQSNTNYSLTAASAAVMGEKVYVFPDKVYFDTTEKNAVLHDMGYSITLASPVFHGDQDTEIITNYITAASAASWNGFQKGDSLIISGTNSKNDTVVVRERGRSVSENDIVSVIVEKIEGRNLYLLCHNSAGKAVMLTSMTPAASLNVKIEKYIPDMDYICVHNNRLFGAGADGRFIYASKLGDGCNYNSFAGLSTDSWWSEVATDGRFTGIVSYQNHVYAFKRDCFHEVYGDKPANFKIPYITKTGCIDGRSITEKDGALYFAGADGIYVYDGGAAKNIALPLDTHITSAIGGADHENIYMRLDDALYVYHTARRMWYRYDDTPIYDIFFTDGELFFAEEGGLFLQGGENNIVCWSLTSKLYRTGFLKANLIHIWLQLSLGEGAQVRVSVSEDGGAFHTWDTVYADVTRSVRIPMRMNKCDTFQLKLEGVGDCMLYGIRFECRTGGKNTQRTGGMLSWQEK